MCSPRFVEFLVVFLLAMGAGAASGSGGPGKDVPAGARAAPLVHDAPSLPAAGPATESKIRFALERLNADGLQGPPGGLRALHYEYCIPDMPDAIRQVTAIDPTLEIQRGSPGRVGCGQKELLCLGHTHHPDHRAVLERLAALPFVTEIREAFFE